MKKLLSLSIIIVLVLLTVACNKVPVNNEFIKETGTVQSDISTDLYVENTQEPQPPANNNSDVGGGIIESRKYRQCYYDVPYDFIILVGEEEYEKWYDETYEFNPDKSQIVPFIQYFNISKEDFEKTNLQMAKSFAEFNPTMRPMDYENQQTYEIYNADILYTFDDEIINAYYLTPDWPYGADFNFESAVERGEYTPRTEVWVDIEQMEAEIIAKYGETEIVPEEPTNALEEIATTPEEPAVTTEDSEPTQVTETVTNE